MKKLVLFLFVITLFYTRMVGLDWGLPYPFHPDERNMANAIERLSCQDPLDFRTCMNPDFYAYGQPPLYMSYYLVQGWHLINGNIGERVSFNEATMALRIISAVSSILLAILMLAFISFLRQKKGPYSWKPDTPLQYAFFLTIIFSPYLIQFAHFGTTESMLMLFYTFILYKSAHMVRHGHNRKSVAIAGIVCGIAIAVKISSLVFLSVPLVSIMYSYYKSRSTKKSIRILLTPVLLFVVVSLLLFFVTSPHYIISWKQFINSMAYESAVCNGSLRVFYTQTFAYTQPIIFQVTHILPHALGWATLLGGVCAFFLLPRTPVFNLLRFALLVYFLPFSFIYCKWTRFIAPVLPFFTVLALVGVDRFVLFLRTKKISRKIIAVFIIIFSFVYTLEGGAFLSIYEKEDVRVTASRWINENIPEGSYILSETANVINLPIYVEGVMSRSYTHIPFDFYHAGRNANTQEELDNHIRQADYIFVPSRRVYRNHSCHLPQGAKPGIWEEIAYSQNRCQDLEEKHPIANEYYRKLFSGELGFYEVAVFDAYPRISVFDRVFMELKNEHAEETWTVFDHPVIRVYQRAQ